MMFFSACGLSMVAFISDRKEGFWNRSLLAGVKTSEMIFAQSLVHFSVMFIMNIETIATALVLIDMENHGSVALLFTLSMLYGFSGLFFGMFISITTANLSLANAIVLGVSNIMGPISGKSV